MPNHLCQSGSCHIYIFSQDFVYKLLLAIAITNTFFGLFKVVIQSRSLIKLVSITLNKQVYK